MSNRTALCDAPTCSREAVWLASGTDYDETSFADVPVCQSCADYLGEAGGERVAFVRIQEAK